MNYSHLYIHVPFCATKCHYCAFYSSSYNKNHVDNYLHKISSQLQQQTENLQQLKSIFIGGGTPSILSATQLDSLLSAITNNSKFLDNYEFSIEINPESLTAAKSKILAKYNINRASIGVQSFNPRLRNIIGRKGNIQTVNSAINFLTENHITNINIDLIFNIPSQTKQEWINDLNQACSLPISHISTYSLSIEENTTLASLIKDLDSEQSIEFLQISKQQLKKHLFSQYEISNFSKENKKCQHNNGIWHGETYLGLGPAAASFDGNIRFQQPENLNLWLNDNPPEIDQISPIERARELFVIGLRTIEGWQIDQFSLISNFSIEQLYPQELLQSFISQKLLTIKNNHIALTSKGLLLADQIAIYLI